MLELTRPATGGTTEEWDEQPEIASQGIAGGVSYRKKTLQRRKSISTKTNSTPNIRYPIQAIKSEWIQNTIAGLRNLSWGRSKKRGNDDNNDDGSGYIEEHNRKLEQGLRLAKRQKNEASDLKALREVVEAVCKAAQRRNGLLEMKISEDFGQPVLACQLLIEEIRVPKLILRVQRGYRRTGGATHCFERPPLRWWGYWGNSRPIQKGSPERTGHIGRRRSTTGHVGTRSGKRHRKPPERSWRRKERRGKKRLVRK